MGEGAAKGENLENSLIWCFFKVNTACRWFCATSERRLLGPPVHCHGEPLAPSSEHGGGTAAPEQSQEPRREQQAPDPILPLAAASQQQPADLLIVKSARRDCEIITLPR